jgi:hypothetical protein
VNTKNNDNNGSWVWWFIPVIPALGRQRQEKHEFKDNLGYEILSQKKQKELLKNRGLEVRSKGE